MSVCDLVRNKQYLGIIAVTALGNLFFWGHVPFIQVLAAQLGANAARAGTLSSATGWGNALGCLTVTALMPRRTGAIYTLGMLVGSSKYYAIHVLPRSRFRGS